MSVVYKEIDLNNKIGWLQGHIKTWKVERSGTINKILITIKNEITNEIYFSIDQYWVLDDEKGVLLDDKGEKKLFDTDDEATRYIMTGSISKTESVLNKMRSKGYVSLNEEEREILKNYNKKQKQLKEN